MRIILMFLFTCVHFHIQTYMKFDILQTKFAKLNGKVAKTKHLCGVFPRDSLVQSNPLWPAPGSNEHLKRSWRSEKDTECC